MIQNTSTQIEKQWTFRQFADHFHLHEESVRRMHRQGRIPAVRIGRRYLIPESEVEKLLSAGIPSAEESVDRAIVGTASKAHSVGPSRRETE